MSKDDNTSFINDRLLLFLLASGALLQKSIDPEGIAAEGQVSQLNLDSAAGTWALLSTFPDGVMVRLGGTYKPDGGALVGDVALPAEQDEWERVPVKAEKTLSRALGSLSGIPARLKHCLSSKSNKKTIRQKKVLSFADLEKLLRSAAFCDVEGAETPKDREPFTKWTVKYLHNENDDEYGNPREVKFAVYFKTDEGRIVVHAFADMYGLGGKKVTLERNLGMNRAAYTDCVVWKNGRKMPSLKAALDLDGSIPMLYVKERRKKISIGKPRAK